MHIPLTAKSEKRTESSSQRARPLMVFSLETWMSLTYQVTCWVFWLVEVAVQSRSSQVRNGFWKAMPATGRSSGARRMVAVT